MPLFCERRAAGPIERPFLFSIFYKLSGAAVSDTTVEEVAVAQREEEEDPVKLEEFLKKSVRSKGISGEIELRWREELA